MVNAPYNRTSNAQIAATRKARFYQLEELRTKMAMSAGMANGRPRMMARGMSVRKGGGRGQRPVEMKDGYPVGSPFLPAEGLDFKSLF